MNIKKLFFISIAVAASVFSSKATDALTYQVAVADNAGKPLVSTPLTFTISIYEGQPSGDKVYAEIIETESSPAGVAYLKIGENGGSVSLKDLDWVDNTYFIEVNYEYDGGKVSLGTTQILSVPHALHADTASSLVISSQSGKRFKVRINESGELTATPID